ncbi:Miraculin [Bienertia sinuspersici]
MTYPTTNLLFFLYVPIIIATSTSNKTDTLVRDVEGNPLEPGSPYYIRTELSKISIGGGIVTASRENHPQCPQYVAQLAVGWYGESPVRFYPTNPSEKHIHISSNLNIIFNTTSSPCSQGVWHLTPDPINGYFYLSISSNTTSDQTTTDSWLKIERSIALPGFYQLEYCPTTNTGRNDIVCGVIDGLPDFPKDLRKVWLGLSTQSPNLFHILSFLKA